MENKEIVQILRLTGTLMELHGENSFRAKSFNNAARYIEKIPDDLNSLSEEQLAQKEGIGKGIARAIKELTEQGTASELEDLLSKTPEGIMELLNIKGIGPKKIQTAWQELGIESPEEFYKAAKAGKLSALKGFGGKTEQSILEALGFYFSTKGKFLYAEAEPLALKLEKSFSEAGFPQYSISGELRRNMEIADHVEMVATPSEEKNIHQFCDELDYLEKIPEKCSPFVWRGKDKESGIPVEICQTSKDAFYPRLLVRSSSPKHLAKKTEGEDTLMQTILREGGNSEQECYQKAGLPYIPPELREGMFEYEWSKENSEEDLLKYTDLQGIFHNHTTFSDGKNTLEEMAVYCRDLGYKYLGISDHSKSAFYANGLDERRIEEQQKEIDRLNKEMAPFKIFKGIESDILNDGSLDYDNDVLASFDFIVASIHGNLKMDEKKATERLLSAVTNPYTTMLGHPTGRLLLKREGYPIHHKAVIDACAEHNVIIEINANPWRLDLDWRWVHYALDKGVLISINPDAHETAGYHDMYYGVQIGRKGGLTPARTFNAWSLEKVTQHLQSREVKTTT